MARLFVVEFFKRRQKIASTRDIIAIRVNPERKTATSTSTEAMGIKLRRR